MAAVAVLLLAYVGARTIRVSLTYDEAATYFRYIADAGPTAPFRFDVATNHLLNTVLTRLSVLAFGDSELALRLPNLLGYGLYLYWSGRLLLQLESPLIGAAMFLLLHLNPHAVEYAGLSRGYGLALALYCGGLYFMTVRLAAADGAEGAERATVWSVWCLVLALTANFAFLTVCAATLAVLAAALVARGRTRYAAGQPVRANAAARPWTTRWILAGAFGYLAIVLGQDIHLSGALYEPIAVYLPADVGETRDVQVARLDVRRSPTPLQREGARAVWRDATPGPCTGMRIQFAAAEAQVVALPEVAIGGAFFRGRPEHWRVRQDGGTRILESTPSLTLPRSRLMLFEPFVNWRGEARWVAVVALYAGGVWLLLIGLRHALSLAGRAATPRWLRQEDWTALSGGLFWAAVVALVPLYILQRNGELYYGGTHGLITDTARSLVDSWFHGRTYHAAQVGWVLALAAAPVAAYAVLLLATRNRVPRRSLRTAGLLIAIALLTTLLVEVEHTILNAPYPLGRTALYYGPLAVLFAAFVCDCLGALGRAARGVVMSLLAVGSMLTAGHFVATADFSTAFDWPRDAATKAMMRDVRRVARELQPSSRQIVLGVDWVYFAGARYYAGRGGPPAVEVLNVPASKPVDFLYGHDAPATLPSTALRTYPAAGSVLARVAR